MIKAVIFDLDGTLLNRDESLKLFINLQYDRLINQLGHMPKEKYVSRFIELDRRGYVWKDKVYTQLADEFNIIALSPEDLLSDYIAEFKNCCVPFSGLFKMLSELKSENLFLGMITNGYGQFQMDNIETLNIKKYFDTILISEWEGTKKPDAIIFNRALERLGVTAHESIYIGDHPENDVKAAQSVGMKAIWKRDSQWNHVDADGIIDELSEIPFILGELGTVDKRW
ncbi:HAD family hydrolase [Litchfieldia alkalitelluris]|uniref:HAD family hydrolase n=1 Tax=Litchfieldia alkalitelluris TaxID=304268 RepID=UPI0009973D05|nr:HAD family hydrolase [Litchfieldia alkalitelluris]